jgi:chitinase
MLQKSTRTALKDARQTVYVNGRWILANDHVIYRILRSTLPTDGDYLAYFKDFQQKEGKLKDESHQLDDIDRQFQNQTANVNNINNSALWTSSSTMPVSSSQLMDKQTILSGLTYTVQFVNLIAFYLGIILPYNLPHK